MNTWQNGFSGETLTDSNHLSTCNNPRNQPRPVMDRFGEPNREKTVAVAATYSSLLREQLTRKEMDVVADPYDERNEHNFLDANVVMDEALKTVTGQEWKSVCSRTDSETENETRTWNRATAAAKSTSFSTRFEDYER
jgi:hypothetical protein